MSCLYSSSLPPFIQIWNGTSLFPLWFIVLPFSIFLYKFLFNGLVDPPRFIRTTTESTATLPSAVLADEEARHLLAEHVLDETAALPADLGQGGFDVVPPPERGQQQHSHPRND